MNRQLDEFLLMVRCLIGEHEEVNNAVFHGEQSTIKSMVPLSGQDYNKYHRMK
jgi:hypothetical protein